MTKARYWLVVAMVAVGFVLFPACAELPGTPPAAATSPVPTATPGGDLADVRLPVRGATLTPLSTLPEGAISGDSAVKLFFIRRFGQDSAEAASQGYPARAVGVLYSAPPAANGLTVDRLPAWVVIIDGLSGPAGSKGDGYKVETVVILDAITGAELTGWEQGRFLTGSPTPVGTVADSESPVTTSDTAVAFAATASPTPLPTTTATSPSATATPTRASANTLTMVASPPAGGSTYPDPGNNAGYAEGAVAKIDAMAASGWTFVNWTGPVTNPFSHNTNVTMKGNLTVTANFERLRQDDVGISLEATTWAVGLNNHFSVAVNTSVRPGQMVDSVEAYIDFDPAYVQVDDATSLIAGIQIQPSSTFPRVVLNKVDNISGHIEFAASALAAQSSTRELLVAVITFAGRADTGASPTAIRISKTAPRRSAVSLDEAVLSGPSSDCLATIGGRYGSYYLTVGLSPEGTGSTTPPPGGFGPEAAGSVINISARPSSGYAFVNWTGPVAEPTNPNTTVTLNSNTRVTANFAPSG